MKVYDFDDPRYDPDVDRDFGPPATKISPAVPGLLSGIVIGGTIVTLIQMWRNRSK